MLLLDFINSHPDWREVLSAEPYCLKIKDDSGYIVLKYHQFNSDFSNELVKEARGVIIKETKGQYKCVCHPFNKFFNYGEIYAAKINWEQAHVVEKIDGSLIKFFYDDTWHITTNNCVNAYNVFIDDAQTISFGSLVSKAVPDLDSFLNTLDKNHVYMFELTSPESKLVVDYKETALYYLGERDKVSDKEIWHPQNYMETFKIKFPEIYPINTVDKVLEFVKGFGEDKEGCVVCDNDFNRVKIKGDVYLTLFHTILFIKVSNKTILKAIHNDYIDELVAYNPQAVSKYENFTKALKSISKRFETSYVEISNKSFDSRKDFAKYVIENFPKEKDYLFYKSSYPDITASDYLLYKVFPRHVLTLIEEEQTDV